MMMVIIIIIMCDKKEKTCLLSDIAIPDDSNINTKEAEKLSKYTYLEIEVSRMLEGRTEIVPVIIGALGTIKKGFDQNLQLLKRYLLTIVSVYISHDIKKF